MSHSTWSFSFSEGHISYWRKGCFTNSVYVVEITAVHPKSIVWSSILPLDKVLGRILRTQGLAKLLGNWVKHTSKLRQVSVSRCWGAHWLIIFWGDPKKLAGIHRLWRAGKQMLTLAKWRWWCLVAVVVVVVAASVSMSAIHWHSSNVL